MDLESRLKRIPHYIFSYIPELERIESSLKKMPSEILIPLAETSLTDLHLLPFHPNKDVSSFAKEHIKEMKIVIEAKKMNDLASRNFAFAQIIGSSNVLLDDYYSGKSPSLNYISRVPNKLEQQRFLTSNFVLNDNTLSKLVSFERKNYPDSRVLLNVLKTKVSILQNDIKGYLKYLESKPVVLEMGSFKGNLSRYYSFYQLKHKHNISLLESLSIEVYNAIKTSNLTYKVPQKSKKITSKKSRKPRHNPKKQTVDLEKLSSEQKLAYYFKVFNVYDYNAIELVTTDLIKPGENYSSKSRIKKISKILDQNPFISVLSSENIYLGSGEKPRTQQYVLVPSKKAINTGFFQPVFPQVTPEKLYFKDLTVRLSTKGLYDALEYHHGEKAHNLYRKRKETFRFTLKKKSDIMLFDYVQDILRKVIF